MKIKVIIASFAFMLMVGTANAYPEYGAGHTKPEHAKHDNVNPENAKHGKHNKLQTFDKLSEEQQKSWSALHDKLVNDSLKMQMELKAKRMEYRALKNNSEVKPLYLRELTERIVELEVELDKLNQEFIKQSKQEYNLDFSYLIRNYSGFHNGENCPMLRYNPHYVYNKMGIGGHGMFNPMPQMSPHFMNPHIMQNPMQNSKFMHEVPNQNLPVCNLPRDFAPMNKKHGDMHEKKMQCPKMPEKCDKPNHKMNDCKMSDCKMEKNGEQHKMHDQHSHGMNKQELPKNENLENEISQETMDTRPMAM